MSEWTFLSKHGLVLSLISRYPSITGHELAHAIGLTERQIRTIIADLCSCGYVIKEKVGRGIRYTINTDLKLRHCTQRETDVGDFLAALRTEGKEAGSTEIGLAA